MGIVVIKMGTTSDLALCTKCDWTSDTDVYSYDVAKAAKNHVKNFCGHKVLRETATATHYFEDTK